MTGIVPAKLTTLVVISGDSWTALVLVLPKNQASAYVEEHRRLTRLTMASVLLLLLLFAFVYVCFLLCLITLAFCFLFVLLFVCLCVFVFCSLFVCLLASSCFIVGGSCCAGAVFLGLLYRCVCRPLFFSSFIVE